MARLAKLMVTTAMKGEGFGSNCSLEKSGAGIAICFGAKYRSFFGLVLTLNPSYGLKP